MAPKSRLSGQPCAVDNGAISRSQQEWTTVSSVADFRLERLAEIPGLVGRYDVLDSMGAGEVHRKLWQQGHTTPENFVDLGGLSTEAGTAALANIDISPASRVWVSYLQGGWTDTGGNPVRPLTISTDWAAFTQFWDDFWYPSGDDIRVAPIDGSRIVEINHEEELRELR